MSRQPEARESGRSPRPHSSEWYDRLATLQQGYYFPWRSKVAPGNGEDAYAQLVREHLSPEKDVLDSGCGHGEFTLTLAPLCRSLLAYDRVPSYIALARKAAREQGVENVTFICADSASTPDRPATIPAAPNSFDVLISRRGPLHWIEDARRVARPGGVLLQLNPMEGPHPPWNEELPEGLRRTQEDLCPSSSMRSSVERRLGMGRLELHSCWTFDVPEYLEDPEQLYLMLTWGQVPEEVPAFDAVRGQLTRVFEQYRDAEGLAVRHRRLLWKAVVD